VAQNVNLSTGKIELLVGHPTDMATQSWANSQLATKQAAIPSLTYGTMQHTSTNGILMGNNIQFGSLSPGTIRFQYNWQWGPHQINYDPYYFNIYVDGYAPFNIQNSAGTAFTVQANSLNIVTGGSITQNSDEKLKTDVANLDYEACKRVFDKVEAKTYRRIDYETDKTRCGFIAQDVEVVLPESMQNIIGKYRYKLDAEAEELEYVGIDYSRLSSVILWGVCKIQQQQLANLSARVVALEGKRI